MSTDSDSSNDSTKINEIKQRLRLTNLVSHTGLNKHELLALEKQVILYNESKSITNYRKIMFGNTEVSLNDEQHKVVTEDICKNIRIVACAGSGKTTTIICRIKYLIDHGVLPARIMITTFNVDAAESMKKKLESVFGFMPNVMIGTIDSISCRFYYKYFRKDHFIGISEYSTELLKFLLDENGNKITNQFDYVFFDEFQDANDTQFDILKVFKKDNAQISVVGDDAQNIYQWRGSNIDYILNFEKYIEGTITHMLVNNYRSTPEIIAFANASIKNNTDQIPKDMIANIPSIGVKPQIRKFENDIEQCLHIIKEIAVFHNMGIKMDNIAIISRNNHSLKVMEEQLEKFNRLNSFKIPYVALITEEGDIKPKMAKNHVTLTTIFKAKGLEFDVVFAIGCNDEKFPAELDRINIQQERRLFYVLVTRPRKYLKIYFTSKAVTRFVAEIPQDLYKFIDFKQSYFQFNNFRGLKYKNSVVELVNMLEPKDIDYLRKNKIIPEISPISLGIHSGHDYSEIVSKNYLHADFNSYVDRYITRLISILANVPDGLKDRAAEKVIESISLSTDDFAIYNKYQPNFSRKINTYNNTVESLDRTSLDPTYIRKIDNCDKSSIQKIAKAIIHQSKKVSIDPKEIMVLPFNYLPREFHEQMRDSYTRFKNDKKKTVKIKEDVYQISLCENITDGRRRLLYKNVFENFNSDKELYTDIKIYLNKIKKNKLICKKLLLDKQRDIVGELDILDLTRNTIVDLKCSTTTDCKLDWIIQLLTYVAMLNLTDPILKITDLEIYNPMMGTQTALDISTWNKGTELLDYLYMVRDRNLAKI
jgi:hypothetical protein